ncbi:heterogeneous nuclear ribonucleoprotein 1-like [Cucumis melo var. makuwa]|uniref:Heterogeneous nuclear ribonucleoprotein 1-like n=1 Tax=Cucumis melo var. makuwa TaxID=1194695 RepID=A0A5D3B757_CUCMM|nr:heterogeneous nuclear ribonucleoprotein 1-like [Cucumis melo var. makuwa]TYJ95682.1 heterogeneous nuclear ribonucleoprotein 1-like [Cucumis melo var. makuwa]
MDSDQGKLFIGGISWETSEDKLKDYFSNYGEVMHTVVMRDKITSRPRGFGFVVFSDPSVLDRVLQDKHTIDEYRLGILEVCYYESVGFNCSVEAKRALSREEQQTPARASNSNGRNSGGSGGGNMRTKKIFVGGLPPTLTEEGFKEYFEAYGHVTDVVVMYDQNTRRPRGFGFISFDSEEAVDRVLHKTFHDLNGKQVEVKRALPKDANPGAGGRSMGGGAGSGGYQGYGSSGGVNSNSYDNRMDSNRYMQSQGSSGGFPPYGSSGYSNPAYGYGSSNNGMGYGGYGNYSGSNTGFGAPAAVAYGNPNVANAGYGSGPQGGPRNSWSGQAPSGYGAMGYGNAAPWGGAPGGNAGAGSGGPGSAPTGHSPGGAAAGYGNQGYGYGGFGNQGYGYGGGDGSYGSQSGYGTTGGRTGSASNSNVGGGSGGELQGNNAYMGNGYGDANGNTGYGNAAWRSDGGQVGYTGGYAGGQARQAQQQRDARSCKSGVKRVHSWLNTGFIMKDRVGDVCVQHLWNSRTFNRLKNGFTPELNMFSCKALPALSSISSLWHCKS